MKSYSWFIDDLIEKGWSFKPFTEKQGNQLSSDANRALNLIKETPLNFQNFIQNFQELISKGEDSWFLSYYDYINDSDFSWNEYEKLSIQSTEEDDDEMLLLKKFWNTYLPFAYSVRNGYSYLAIGLSGTNKGKIIYGREPIFEDFSIEADSFDELLDSLILKTSQKESDRLLDFI